MVIYWYDYICFAIVAASYLWSLWVLWRKEISTEKDSSTKYESLLVARTDSDVFIDALPANHVGSSQLWTSCWKGVHPGWLLATRFISFVVMGGFLLWDLSDWGSSIYMYYTEWTFTLVMVYFAVATVTSGYGCWISSTPVPSQTVESAEYLRSDVEDVGITNSLTYREKEIRGSTKFPGLYAEGGIRLRAGIWGYLMQTIYQTGAGAVIITDVIFWCLIVPFGSIAHLKLSVLMGGMHSLNAVFLLLDTSLNSLPFPWFRIAYFVQWSCIYVVFQWVIHAMGFTWWPYPFLDLELSWTPIWCLILAVIHIPCYGVYLLIVKAKNSLFSKWFPHSFVRSN